MSKFKIKIIAAATLMASVSANADVSIDELGLGFVDKDAIQAVYDWNNSMLQAKAHLLQFKFSSAGTMSWYCEGLNNTGVTVTTNVRNEDIGISTYIAYDSRKNRAGQITGFILTGFGSNAISSNNYGSCGTSKGFKVPFQLVSEIYQSSDKPSLKVRIDGEAWLDLEINNFRLRSKPSRQFPWN